MPSNRRRCPFNGRNSTVSTSYYFSVSLPSTCLDKTTPPRANLSVIHPRLFSTLVFFDPVIITDPASGSVLTHLTNERRDIWQSQAEAEDFFRKSRLYKTWDSRVLDRWLRYGLRSIPTELHPSSSPTSSNALTLATTKHQEAWTFARSCFAPINLDPEDPAYYESKRNCPDVDLEMVKSLPFYRAEPDTARAQLPFIRPSLLYVFVDKSALSAPAYIEERMRVTGTGIGGSGGVKAGKVAFKVFEKTGHLLTFEKVNECASVTAQWLVNQLKAFKTDNQRGAEDGSEKSERGVAMSPEWRDKTKEWMLMERKIARRGGKL